MTDVPADDGRVVRSTTLLLALAAAGVAVVTILGEEGAFTAMTVVGALAGLVPWALVAGGVALPAWAFTAMTLPAGLLIVLGGENPGGMFPLMVALVWLIWTSPTLVWPMVTAGAALAAIVTLTLRQDADETGTFYFIAGVGISWLSGALLRRQERLTAQVAAMRDEQVARLAATERANLSREVHDVVAHSLAVVMLNLTGARRALATDPARADEALARAEAVGRDSLDSIRQVMELLREPGAAGTTLPRPTLAGIPRLVDGYRHAGLDVTLTMDAAPDALDPTVELIVYRVVQESLANVLQHAPGATAEVALSVDADGLGVLVRNGPATSRAPRSGRSGLGTRGMAERVRAVGGTFEAGATETGGWRVAAWLPARRVDEREPLTMRRD